MSRRIEPYWYAIIPVLVLAGGLFAYHLATGNTPPRAAITLFGFPIYWYGIWIVTGIALGAWVVARLATAQARRAFDAAVPVELRERPLSDTPLSKELLSSLAQRRVTTLGQLIWEVGLDPLRLSLKKPQTAEVVGSLAAVPDVAPAWLADAPWRRWNPDHVWNSLLWILLLGLIGARLYHVLTPSPSMAAVGIYSPLDYFREPLQLLNFRGGGLGIYGGLAGGLLGMLIYVRRNRLPLLGWADLSVVGLALGQSIGRWGNFFNQELYGRPTDLPWAIHIDPIYRLPDYVAFERFHPAFLYESLWSLMTFLVLLRLARRHTERLMPGELMALYLIAYAAGRTLLETVRLDSRAVPFFGLETGLAVATLVSLTIALIAAAAVIIRRYARRPKAVG
ncbi:MAG: prolipoprotein diacylglyceryl transferase [Candidatus Promineofilum sp.]|uniref:prolipoprotein diacylglyceryl transferase n=1 Tax=Promineifilum sp. TaxID=2664178 RepID=UPI002411C77C|nr:prolipoprotein diacylglyceryl transferase [Promineifilum sp.]